MTVKRITVGEIRTNCYIIAGDNEAAVIDPGGESGKILKALESFDAKPKYIINTHYHFDHTLANEELKHAWGAKILIGAEEKKEKIDFNADRFLSQGDIIKVGNIKLEAIHTPGHSQGSICLLGEEMIFTGDTLFESSIGRTDLPTGSDTDMRETLERLSKLIKPGMKVYPGHGEPFKYQAGIIEDLISRFYG